MKNLIIVLTTLLFMTSCYKSETVDLIIHNATIYTMDETNSMAEAMAVKDGKIIAIGPENQIMNKYFGEKTIDAGTRPVYPGFNDAHCHFFWYGRSFQEVDLTGAKSWDEAIQRVVDFAKGKELKFIGGNGWDQNLWKGQAFPTKQKLDSLFPNTPVLLKRVDSHAAIANQAALDIAEVDATTTTDGGIFKLNNGELTGLLIDMAITYVEQKLPRYSDEEDKKSLLTAQKNCFEKGLTTVADAMLENKMIHLIDDLQKEGRLKMRIYGMATPSEENLAEYLLDSAYKTDRLHIGAIKFFADGALGSRGAKLIEPYSDDTTNSGLFLNDSTYLQEMAHKIYESGLQMNTHCIGDDANRLMLNIYGNALKKVNDRRWRIEHAQIVHPDDMKLFRKYTIIPSVQPTHAISDMDWVEDRLGADRLKSSYAFKTLLSQNGLLPLGTDFPIEKTDPLLTFYTAVARKNTKGLPENGFLPEERLSRLETLKGMTIWPAIASFEENEKGSLEVGKYADFVLLDKDIMTIEESDILKAKVMYTVVGGEVVYGD